MLRGDEQAEPSRMPIVVLEQKSISLIKYLVHKFLKRRKLIVDPFAGNLSTAQACLLVEKHCHFLDVSRMLDARRSRYPALWKYMPLICLTKRQV